MEKIVLLCLCAVAAAGCAAVETPDRGLFVQTDIRIVSQKPQGCRFLAGVLGEQNDAAWNWTEDLTGNIRANAARLGGNVAYVRMGPAAAPGSSDEYFRDFYVDGVHYGALIYKCP